MNYFDILLAQKTGYIPHNHFDALFARKIGGAVLKDFPGLPASIVTVTDALAKPLDSLKVAITPIQSGSGDPSPDNIRPISGWTECKVNVSGVNIWDEEWEVGRWSLTTGGKTSSTNSLRCKSHIPVKPNETFYFKNDYNLFIGGFDANNNFIGQLKAIDHTTSIKNKPVYTPNNCYFIVFYTDNTNTYNNDISINYPSTDTDYHAYTGQTYHITFPSEAGTVYGGTLDVTTGALSSIYVRQTYDGTETEWRANSLGNGYYIPISGSEYDSEKPLICNCLLGMKSGSSSGMSINSIRMNTAKSNLLCRVDTETDFPTVDDWKAFLAQNPMTVLFPLAESITYQLTPTEVQMLLGTNNIWADTGDILEGKYWSKNPVTVTQAMLNTLRDAGEITEITEPEENDER